MSDKCLGCDEGLPTWVQDGVVVHKRDYGLGSFACKDPTWQEYIPPAPLLCDLCNSPAAWVHPAGGRRCESCPRPDTF